MKFVQVGISTTILPSVKFTSATLMWMNTTNTTNINRNAVILLENSGSILPCEEGNTPVPLVGSDCPLKLFNISCLLACLLACLLIFYLYLPNNLTYLLSMFYIFSISAFDRPVAWIIVSVGKPMDFIFLAISSAFWRSPFSIPIASPSINPSFRPSLL